MSFESIRNLPNSNSSDVAWLNWYKDLRSTLGKKNANQLFIQHWEAEDGFGSDANTTYLREELDKYNLKISGGTLGSVADFGNDVSSFFGDLFTAGKWLTIGMGTVVVVAVGGLLIQIAFNKKVRGEAIRVGSAVATRGATEIGK